VLDGVCWVFGCEIPEPSNPPLEVIEICLWLNIDTRYAESTRVNLPYPNSSRMLPENRFVTVRKTMTDHRKILLSFFNHDSRGTHRTNSDSNCRKCSGRDLTMRKYCQRARYDTRGVSRESSSVLRSEARKVAPQS
jgi:hypothetical protein